MSGPQRRVDRDPGLQAERTLLAWSRTALVLAVNATLVLRTGFVDDRPDLAALGAVLAAAASGTYAYGLRRRGSLERSATRAVGVGPLRVVAATVVLVAVAAAWCVLVGVPPTR